MTTHHGRLLDVIGRPCTSADGVIFCPARVVIRYPRSCHPLARYHRPGLLSFGEFDFPDDDIPDALWVRGRLPGLFGYRPLQVADGRSYLLNAGFVAVCRDPVGGYAARPFAVTDEACGDTQLVMSRRESAAGRGRIARQFWGLLAARGVDQDFRAEGLEWYGAFDDEGLEPVEVLWEAGLWKGVYYAESVAHDGRFDPDFDRPDRSLHRYRCPPSRRRRRIRHVA